MRIFTTSRVRSPSAPATPATSCETEAAAEASAGHRGSVFTALLRVAWRSWSAKAPVRTAVERRPIPDSRLKIDGDDGGRPSLRLSEHDVAGTELPGSRQRPHVIDCRPRHCYDGLDVWTDLQDMADGNRSPDRGCSMSSMCRLTLNSRPLGPAHLRVP